MRKLVWTGVLAIAAVAFGGGVVLSQDKDAHKGAEKGGEKGGPDDAMMAEWMKLGQPGPHHKHLEAMVGDWEVAGKFWEDPTKPPSDIKGTATYKAILGGRYIVEDFASEMMGQPFQGHGIYGYDNMSKKHTAVWMDTMSTNMMFTQGACDKDCKTITLEGFFPDPQGNLWGWRSVSTDEGKDKHTMVAYNTLPAEMKLPEGVTEREHKAMELHYTRKK
jgi:hypothetical protein